MNRFDPVRVVALTASVLALVAPAIAGQSTGGESAPPQRDTLLRHLSTLNYDAARNGPLIVVNPERSIPPDSGVPDSAISLPTLASAAHLRIVDAGNAVTLAPPTMAHITAKPGRADPMAGMSPSELLELLMGTFTPAQWQLIGSVEGVGAADLEPDQRQIWDDFFPAQLKVRRQTIGPGDTPHSSMVTADTFIDVTDTSAARLRLNKTATFLFGGDPGGASTDFSNLEIGRTTVTAGWSRPRETKPLNRMFGVSLTTQVPASEKPGDVVYSSPTLDPPISLHFDGKIVATGAEVNAASLPTVGDLIQRIDDTTHLWFIASSRVRDLPVFLRGDRARSGDVLRALARAVSGTYRVLPAARPGETVMYLLTWDRDGIGTQVGRLEEWADDANAAKQALLRKAAERMRKVNPVRFLSFAPDDRFALTSEQSESVESAWRGDANTSSPEVTEADLSPMLQASLQEWRRLTRIIVGSGLDVDHPHLGEELSTSLILPGIGAADYAGLDFKSRQSYFKDMLSDPAPAPTWPAPFAWPSMLIRRVLIAAPKTADEAANLAHAAAEHGFTDLYLQVGLTDAAASARLLEAGVRAGAASHIAIGATVHLLRDAHAPEEPDRNILGETGAEYAARVARHRMIGHGTDPRVVAAINRDLLPYAGWLAPPDAAVLASRLAPLAAVPGLAALTLRDSAAPGWNGKHDPPDFEWTNGRLGYTLAERRAYISRFSLDPIDFIERGLVTSEILWIVGYFSPDLSQTYLDFRAGENRNLLAGIYAYLRRAQPALPLYLDDRVSAYSSADTGWFASWTAADHLPVNPMPSKEIQARAAGHAKGQTLIAICGNTRAAAAAETPLSLAGDLGMAMKDKLPPMWDGVAVDLAAVPTAEVLRLLTALPPAGTPAGEAAGP